jgi:Spy/CpxP family protein refolding chaperone
VASPGGTLLQRNVVLITSPNVALDLSLSQSQAAQRDKLVQSYQETRDGLVSKLQAAATDGARDVINANIGQEQEQLELKLLALLTPPQMNRLKQIGVQQEGIAAMQDDAIAKDLALTAAQRTKIKGICDATQKAQDDYQAALGEAIAKIPDPGTSDEAIKAYEAKQQAVVKSMKPREKQYLAVKAAGDKQILAVLTPAQKNKWAAMRGKPLKGG